MSLTIDLYENIPAYKVHFRGCALIPAAGKRSLATTNQVAARLFAKVRHCLPVSRPRCHAPHATCRAAPRRLHRAGSCCGARGHDEHGAAPTHQTAPHHIANSPAPTHPVASVTDVLFTRCPPALFPLSLSHQHVLALARATY